MGAIKVGLHQWVIADNQQELDNLIEKRKKLSQAYEDIEILLGYLVSMGTPVEKIVDLSNIADRFVPRHDKHYAQIYTLPVIQRFYDLVTKGYSVDMALEAVGDAE